ncbi:Hint domain-containing protein [Paracoccus sp. Z118]|uniref:Hint domain-containing protein n=1 Tax=Paracoccus sp. Z118 TaxID=2851017 RepID=UPI001C2C1E7C|nr:Hint domain-containing protein [Paracoccus sp. Z118]MBV0890476.1 Hint domain-containing protein [Paracoccus sp. Z118]
MHKPPAPIGEQFQAIYLGDVKPDQHIDRFEALPGTETSFALLGTTFGSAGAPLTQGIVAITTQDRNGDGMLRGDTLFRAEETFSTDRPLAVDGGMASAFAFDGVTQYRATLTYLDGSQAKGVVVTVMQDDQGRTFLVPNRDGGNDALTAGPIKSLTLTGLAELNPFNNNLDTTRPQVKFVPCFAGGTRIMTAKGHRPVERIAVGDLVQTVDHGLQVVRWAGARRLDAVDLAANLALLPIRIRRGALGERLPRRDLLVSPQHRVMVRSAVARAMFGADEVLVAAKHLLALDGVEIARDLREVTYHHILFDRHEIVLSEGAASESLFLGEQALLALGEAARNEILTLFPELKAGLPEAGARPFLTGRQGRGLAERHGALSLQ